MFDWFFSFGVRQFFGGARRGQPLVTAFGTAVIIWGLFRRFSNRNRLIYSRTLDDGESVRITQYRGPSRTDEEV
ncbi:MAG: hypothetical protein QNJ81_15080 [Acidimicrobiia bacterium]|nr:hypothetical protein [Acidimicrobiia bacterium]